MVPVAVLAAVVLEAVPAAVAVPAVPVEPGPSEPVALASLGSDLLAFRSLDQT